MPNRAVSDGESLLVVAGEPGGADLVGRFAEV